MCMRTTDYSKKVKVILVDDNFDHLLGIRELINLETNFEVMATATNANIAINLVKKYQPDLVLMDINMPEKDGLTAMSEIEKLNLGTKIIALTGYDDPDLIFRAMKLGAKGYILKTMASAQLIYAIEEVMQGKVYLPSGLSSRCFVYFQKTFKEEAINTQKEEDKKINKYKLLKEKAKRKRVVSE